MKKGYLFVLPVLMISSLVCTLGGTATTAPTPDLASMVSGTLTAVAATSASLAIPLEPPTTTPEAARDFIPPMGTISGDLSYPSEFIPPLRIVAFNLTDGSVSYMDTSLNQGNYTFELPVGDYHIVAYVIPEEGGAPGLAAGYTQSVLCGLSVDCPDHSLVTVTVAEGVTTPNVDPGDWYAPEGAFPPMP